MNVVNKAYIALRYSMCCDCYVPSIVFTDKKIAESFAEASLGEVEIREFPLICEQKNIDELEDFEPMSDE